LVKAGYHIYTLTGASITQLIEAGNPIYHSWQQTAKFENETSPAIEVAINPEGLFLKNSNNRTMANQDRMLENFSRGISRKIKRIKAIKGYANQYSEITALHQEATGESLFGKNYNLGYTRTEDFSVVVGGNSSGLGLHIVRDCPIDGCDPDLWICPLVVPVEVS